MLDLSQKMEVSYKVNQFIKKANEALNLGLHQPHITYKLKGTSNVAQVTGCTINFNFRLDHVIDEDIQRQVAHVINFELNRTVSTERSETYINIMQLLKGNSDIIVSIKKSTPEPKKVTVKQPVKKTGERKAVAVDVFKANPGLTRQEMITKIVEAFDFSNDKKGRIKAAGLYQQAKKAVEA